MNEKKYQSRIAELEALLEEKSARIANYSSIGNAKSWKLGLDWKVYEDLRLRATKSSALRAPNIGELYGEASQTFFRVDDPCRTDNLADLANADQRISNCAALGIPADFNSDYDSATLEGAFRTSLIATYLKDRKEFPFQDNPEVFYQYAGTAGESDRQGVFTINYSRGDWEASWKTRYLERSSLYDNQELARNPNPSNRMELPSYAVTDVTAGYNFANGVSLTVGIDNLFNRALPTGTTGTGSIDGAYDNIGRFGYVTVAYKM